MVFNSLTFLVFLACVFLMHSLPLRWGTKKLNLLVASYLFYAAWNPAYVVLVWISTVVDWFAARGIAAASRAGARRFWVVVTLASNLGLLALFKYGTFLLENTSALLAAVGIDFHPAKPNLVLPIGISFYTFQTLSYSLDVYRGRLRPWSSFRDYALYVSFFPQLVAGPIVRARDFLPQTQAPRQATSQQLGWGLVLLALGLLEKVVLADAVLAPTADRVFSHAQDAGMLAAWIGTLAFTGQIFFDFSGYSLCAVGVGMCLGFALPDNFRFPYAAIGFSDFWRRWHVSLSTWLRDYLYISLGGNRAGRVRIYVNLMLTMLIGGLWHGASWTFVAWGAMHGIFLALERPFRGRRVSRASTLARPLVSLLTFGAVSVAWVFFRARSFGDAFALLRSMFVGGVGKLDVDPFDVALVTLTLGTLWLGQWLLRDSTLEGRVLRLPEWARVAVLATILLVLLLTPGGNRVFIYFQF